jgi:hypothetical protein
MSKEIGNFEDLEHIGIEHGGESKLFGKLHGVIMSPPRLRDTQMRRRRIRF